MPITGDLAIPQSTQPFDFGRTIIDWNRQEIQIQYQLKGTGKNYTIRMTLAQWNYLKNGMQSLMSGIPAVSNVTFPEYDPHMWDEPEIP